jgi:hypothetical protein
MRLLFVKGHTAFSKLIMGVTKESVSHVAMEFQVGPWALVIHSNLLGLHIELAANFRKNCTIVKELEHIPFGIREQDSFASMDLIKVKSLLEQYEFTMYDWGGLVFLGLVLFARAKLGIPLPKSNLWQSTGMFLCSEWVTKYLDGQENSMITPEKLYYSLNWRVDWSDCATSELSNNPV